MREINKKQLFKRYLMCFILCLITLGTMIYFAFSFIFAEFNAFNWSEFSRGTFIFTLLIVLCPVFLFLSDFLLNQKK